MDQVTEQQDNQLTASPACTISVPKAIPWRTAGAWAARVPASAWVVLALFLCAALIMAIQAAFVGRDANLRLKVQHNLRSADLSGANLSGANLHDAIVTNEQLVQAKSLKNATMPDGSKHP